VSVAGRVLLSGLLAGVPAALLACAVSPTERALRIETALKAGYGVQYWGEAYHAEGLARAPHGLLIIDATKTGAPDAPDGREVMFTPDEMKMMRRDGDRPVIVYLNLTEVEPWRDYWPVDGSIPAWLGPRTAAGDHLAAFWRPEWRALLRDRVKRLMATGADGLFLDDALNYFVAGSLEAGPPDRPGDVAAAAVSMLALVQEVAQAARSVRCDALIIVNNAVFVGRDAGPPARDAFKAYREAVDGVMMEDGLGAADHPDLHTALREDYLDHRIPVLALDFAPLGQSSAVSQAALAKGYAPYVVPDGSFSYLAPPAR
jgi:uncharacterized protein (TIGR01370 family)